MIKRVQTFAEYSFCNFPAFTECRSELIPLRIKYLILWFMFLAPWHTCSLATVLFMRRAPRWLSAIDPQTPNIMKNIVPLRSLSRNDCLTHKRWDGKIRNTNIINSLISLSVYTGCPKKKRNGGFSVHCELKVLNILTSLGKASSAEENDA